MFIGINQSIAILAVIVTYYIIDALMFAHHDKERQQGGTGKSWRHTVAMAALAVLLIVQPVVLPMLALSTGRWWGLAIQAIGIGAVLAGLTLHVWAREHLGHFYAERAEFQTGHILVDTGPYAAVRHPTFSSFILITWGLLMINPALTTLLTAAYTLWDFTRAADRDEELLSEKLPEYTEYMARTARFFPRLRRRRRDS